jgi:xanthine dehydrogenase YagT iron-sulfur-binding subunit
MKGGHGECAASTPLAALVFMSVTSHRASPLSIGDAAPALASILPGTPVVLAFHDPEWDPARREALAAYRNLLPNPGNVLPEPVLLPNNGPEAAAFGVASCSAVFVLDEDSHIAWRHVTGTDSIARAAAIVGPVVSPLAELSGQAGQWSRRGFVATILGAAVALGLEPVTKRAEAATASTLQSLGSPLRGVGDPTPVTLNVNGKSLALTLEPRVTLLDALREYAGLTGSKKGCDHGQCGACTVHIDGRRVLSCLTFAVMQQEKKITTIEGLAASAGASGDALHPMQQAFIEHDGFQCGYCTSGQIMSAAAVVGEPWGPADDDVREAMSGNLCRCGAYPGIVAAVQSVRQNGGQSR